MRQDKLTTKFQDALSGAQSAALAHDNQVMEPLHLLAAVLSDSVSRGTSMMRSSASRRSPVRAVTSRFRATSRVSSTSPRRRP